MPFIGNQPALSYTSFAKQDFTTSATTSYTLDQPVANANELALFINFVRQEPTTAYTASGTTLTLTSATSASDDMYCVFLGKAVQTVNPPSGSVGISQLSATGTKDATTFLRGDNTFASAGGVNTPAFEATMSADQNTTNSVFTKIQYDTESFDTNNMYDNSIYRFTPTIAGKYFFYATARMTANANSELGSHIIGLSKNGTIIQRVASNPAANYGNSANLTFNMINSANGSTDYYEIFIYILDVSGTPTVLGGVYSNFGAYKIIE